MIDPMAAIDRPELLVRRLIDICGPGFVRTGGAADEVAGAPAAWVAAPPTAKSVAEVVRAAGEHDLTVVPRGAGTKLDWGAPPRRVDILLDTGRLAGVRHRPAVERAADIGAGTPMRAVDSVLARAGRRLPLDVPSADATLGGVLAADEAGPLRHRHGGAGAHLVRVRYVDGAGALTEAGGEEPAGRDVARLLCGSQGALGVLVSATLRVQPTPAARLWVARSVWTPLQMHDHVRAVFAGDLDPAAIEVDLPVAGPGRGADELPGSIVVLVEGAPGDVRQRAARLVALLGGDAVIEADPPGWWRSYPFQPGQVALRVEAPATDLHAAVYALRDAAGAALPVRGSAGAGVLHAALPASTAPRRLAAILAAVRAVLLARGGRCLVVAAPQAIRESVDLWGDVPTLPHLRRVKRRFDPAGRLAPGRFHGGI